MPKETQENISTPFTDDLFPCFSFCFCLSPPQAVGPQSSAVSLPQDQHCAEFRLLLCPSLQFSSHNLLILFLHTRFWSTLLRSKSSSSESSGRMLCLPRRAAMSSPSAGGEGARCPLCHIDSETTRAQGCASWGDKPVVVGYTNQQVQLLRVEGLMCCVDFQETIK